MEGTATPTAIADLEEFIRTHDGYTLEARAAEILEGLGIPTQGAPHAARHALRRLQAARAARPGARLGAPTSCSSTSRPTISTS
jgi:ATPase subunit of ABC transporter with duplicated ATPase domains